MVKEWYWNSDEVLQGPADIDDLAARCHREELSTSTLIWRDGEDKFSLREVLDQFGKLPPDLPDAPVPSKTASGALQSHLRDQGWTDSTPHPWRRYFARMLDTTIHGSLAFFVFSLIATYTKLNAFERAVSAILGNRILDAILTTAAAMPVNALVIGLTGSSLGKWFFGTRILGRDYRPIGFLSALSREGSVLFRGFGFGIPLVSFCTIITAYRTLNDSGATTWDQSQHIAVIHRPNGPMTTVKAVLGVLTWILLVAFLQSLQ